MFDARTAADSARARWRSDRAGAKDLIDQIALAAAAGDSAAGEVLVGLCVDLRLARLPITDVLIIEADVDDAEQAALITIHLKIDQFDGRGGFTSWIRTVARNEALEVLRRTKRRNETGLEPTEGVWSERMSSQLVDRQRLDVAIARLDVNYREPLVLREHDGLDYQAIADRLGLPIGTVRSRISRARAQVAEHLLAP